MTGLRSELVRLAEGLAVHSPTAFTLFGRRFETSEAPDTVPSDSVLTSHARERLAGVLYSVVHCREPLEPPAAALYDDWLGARDFAERLSAANCGTGSWQYGWRVRDTGDDGRIVVEKFDVRFWVRESGCRIDGDDRSRAWVRLPREYRRLIPGFYMALGDADDDIDAHLAVRVYWHITPAAAVPLMQCLTRSLNESRITFRFKVLDDPQSYHRADAAVLYLRADSYAETIPLVETIYRRFADRLKPAVSPFVKRLAPGLGVAEDPGEEASFGQHRCRLLAAAVASPAWAEATTTAERVDRVVASLQAFGVDPDAVYLQRGSSDVYHSFA